VTARFRPICSLWEYPVRRRVSDKVGDTRNNRAELIEPIPEDPPKREKKPKRTKHKKESPPQGLFDWFSDTSELFGIDPYPSPTADNIIGRDANRPTWSQVVQLHPPRDRRNCLSTQRDFYFVSVLLSGTVMLLGCLLYLRDLSRHLLSGMTRRPTPRPPEHV